MKYIFTVLMVFMTLFSFTANAVAGDALNVNAQSNRDVHDVARAEKYLRDLGTVKANFIQRAGDGGQLSGTFYLNRPGKLRFEYNEVDDFIVADGLFIYFYDSELKQQSNAPIGQTLADFLLRKDLSLTEDLRVKNIENVAPYQIITLVERDDEGAGVVKLFFETAPYALKKWQVIDATGMTTEISLSNMQRDVELRPSLFAYFAPKSDKPQYNE
jgi:outer membrane lipoprotein-sorting protein